MSEAWTLLIIRHGATSESASGRLTSDTDIPLSPRGEQEAASAAEAWRVLPVDRVITSPLQRAMRTASILNASFKAPLANDDRLRELSFGPFESLTPDEMRTRGLLDLFHHWSDPYETNEVAGCETYSSATERVASLFAEYRAEDGFICLVTHSHIARILIATQVLGLPAASHRILKLDTGHAAVVQGRTWPRLVALNCQGPDSYLRAAT